MRISKAGCHVEFEVARILDGIVAQLDVLDSLLFVRLLQ